MNTKTVYLVPTTTFEGEPTIAPLGSATGRRLRVYTDDPHSIVEHPVGEPSFILVCIGSYLDKRDRVTFNDNHELEFEKNMIKAVAVFERPGGSQPSQPNVTWT
jgi:hypothetical protein